MLLYHTGFSEITVPDIRHGRKNADFGQGFYLSADPAFSRRWAKIRKGQTTYVNTYELSTDGLSVKVFMRDAEWLQYIFSNRSGKQDSLIHYDVVAGPIANDTIYNLFGITTSGFLTSEQSLRILTVGPEYTQVALKTKRAADALRFLSSEVLTEEEVKSCRDATRDEEAAYQNQFEDLLKEWIEV
ncbi:MAG: DUF3990 domain-containing protein [Clostridia bacterium]|nr:DUF3990 domain-containing protein [Clostridia bacterium]